MRVERVRYEPSWNVNRGVCCGWGEQSRYLLSAETWQVEVWVAPTVTVQLLRNGSVLEAFMRSCAKEGARETSAWQSERVLSKEWAEEVQSSLARRKP